MYVTQDRTIENMVSLLVYHRVYVDAHSDGPEGKKKKKKPEQPMRCHGDAPNDVCMHQC